MKRKKHLTSEFRLLNYLNQQQQQQKEREKTLQKRIREYGVKMEEVTNIRLKSSEGDIIEFRPELQNLSKLVHGLDHADIIAVEV